MAFNELSTMQTGVVDGAENNPPTYVTQNHPEVAKYYTLTEHLIVQPGAKSSASNAPRSWRRSRNSRRKAERRP